LQTENKTSKESSQIHKYNIDEKKHPESEDESYHSRKVIKNERFDEIFEVDNDDESSIDTISSSVTSNKSINSRNFNNSIQKGHKNNLYLKSLPKNDESNTPNSRDPHDRFDLREFDSNFNEYEEEESEDEESMEPLSIISGQYNPNDFVDLNVSPEIKQIFQFIQRYEPPEIELDTPLKCFIPSYIPAVGEIDPFLKMLRPDGEKEVLGLEVLDEPALHQSHAAALELQLRAAYTSKQQKKLFGKHVFVRSIEDAAKNPQDIEKWITSLEHLHQTKLPAQFHYTQYFPKDTEREIWMTTPWSKEWEDWIRNGKLKLPDPHIDLTIEEYAKVLCTLLDIPVHEGHLLESVHYMMNMFLDFRKHRQTISDTAPKHTQSEQFEQ